MCGLACGFLALPLVVLLGNFISKFTGHWAGYAAAGLAIGIPSSGCLSRNRRLPTGSSQVCGVLCRMSWRLLNFRLS